MLAWLTPKNMNREKKKKNSIKVYKAAKLNTS